ncbi:hypothetical protein DBR32_03320 [Taibaiella sp. KBW10]|uniref:AlbA family DNA-binding domain-containing protein n=1 Tax=Taibaiella sp. KBW10 TaxID=2153357 RepID=UPI000F5A5E2E|nr:ATP-binding protein [Taibaiella sp. KBW10]RQO32636.1 hypothetical protein DBR32_03320 [Taibaiella sp. KBW10]
MELLNLEEFTSDTIDQIINSRLEESINIEFKSGAALSNEKSVKKEISKDVSSFANSDGGLIFYGIEEQNHVASSFSFIDGNTYTKEWLENVILSNIQPKIEGLKIFPIRVDNDIEKTFYVIKIPNSNSSPHINGDKKYYRRFNFQSVPMEEYEIRNLYFKPNKSTIDGHRISVNQGQAEFCKIDHYSFRIIIEVTNSGRYVAEKYKVAFTVNGIKEVQLVYDKSYSYNTLQGNNSITVSNSEMIPIFPKEVYTILRFEISIPVASYEEFIDEAEYKLVVYNLGEMDEYPIDLNPLIEERRNIDYDELDMLSM